ncbi:hypothetical protein ACRC7T_17390 (plasmid) [Segnochrobactraceae bacterium EtOH-i3]
MSRVCAIFKNCVTAIRDGVLIEREGQNDKEFHFQNWFHKRLLVVEPHFDSPGRNTYPDFKLVHFTEGYELKGLAYPGRDASYDSNSQVPCGEHNGRSVFYVFGRYPKKPDGNTYPVLDLVLCHGSFLNADHTYVHKNKSFRGFGSYGDILVRDRKMYVAATPFAIASGMAHRRTLVLPAEFPADADLEVVGELTRRETDRMVVAYNFDLRTNELATDTISNPHAGREHKFIAYRMAGDPLDPVEVIPPRQVLEIIEEDSEEDQ